MGFRLDDVSPARPSTLRPTGKTVLSKIFQVPRSQTTNSLEAVLPGAASIISFKLYQVTASNAATTAVVTIDDGSDTAYYGTVDVKGSAVGTVYVNAKNIPALEPSGSGATFPVADRKIFAKYAETGTASTTGGPWNIVVEYVI